MHYLAPDHGEIHGQVYDIAGVNAVWIISPHCQVSELARFQ